MNTNGCRTGFRFGLFLSFLLLASCGGGGGGGSESAPPPPPPATANAPQITTQPAAQSVTVGAAVTFSVQATGNGTLSYAWRFNGTPIVSAVSSSLSLMAATSADAGSYDVVVTNSLNGTTASTTSSGAALSVVAEPTALSMTAEDAVLADSVGHDASVAAQAGVTYEWKIVNGTIASGQGGPQIVFSVGRLGKTTLMVCATNLAGTQSAIKDVVVASTLPIDSLFAQPRIHPRTSDVAASAPGIAGQTYDWTIDLASSTSATVNGPADKQALSYSVNATGMYQLSLTTQDQAGRTSNGTRQLYVVDNLFLQDIRDATPRSLHTATLLNDGTVLIVGGDAGVPDFGTLSPKAGTQSRLLETSELFDPVSRTWAKVDSITPRLGHSATLLENGRVMVVGGVVGPTAVTSTAYTYNPNQRSWIATQGPVEARAFHSATLLADGRLLIAGGVDSTVALATAEIFDPTAGTWNPAGNMSVARVLHSAVRLQDGRVLVAGGRNETGLLTSAEIYDPTSNTWQAAADAPHIDNASGAVLLPSGKVLVLGDSSYLYDPATNEWTPSAADLKKTQGVPGTTAILLSDGRVLATGRYFLMSTNTYGFYDPAKREWTTVATGSVGSFSTATALHDGTILEVGGVGKGPDTVVPASYQALAQVSVFDPAAETQTTLGSKAHSGADAASARLTNGRVLVSGGEVSRIPTAQRATTSADLYDPTTNQWSTAAPMSTARAGHRATPLAGNRVLVTGGTNSFLGVYASAERFDAATNTWGSAGGMNTPRYKHTATSLADGRVLVVGGSDRNSTCSCTTFQSSVEIYDPAANSWSATASLQTARFSHTATRLADGRVLVTGGFGGTPDTLHAGGAALATVEIYDPATATWSPGHSMSVARSSHAATLLSSGLVLVTGGTDGSTTRSIAEIYDPASDSWSPTTSMISARQGHTSIALPPNRVLVIGGFNNSSNAVFGVETGEVYDVIGNQWTPASLVVPRQRFAVEALADDWVMIVGGEPNYSGLPEFFK